MCSAADDPTTYDTPVYSPPRRYVLAGQPDPDALIAAHPLPSGFTVQVSVQRKYEYRNLWAIRLYRDGDEVWGRANYRLAAGIAEAQRVARDMAGWSWHCYICRRLLDDDDLWRNVDFGLHVERVCETCWEKADGDYLTERLDNTDA